jgi:hypothetical protein
MSSAVPVVPVVHTITDVPPEHEKRMKIVIRLFVNEFKFEKKLKQIYAVGAGARDNLIILIVLTEKDSVEELKKLLPVVYDPDSKGKFVYPVLVQPKEGLVLEGLGLV